MCVCVEKENTYEWMRKNLLLNINLRVPTRFNKIIHGMKFFFIHLYVLS